MPIGTVYGVRADEISKLQDVRKQLVSIICSKMKLPNTSVATFFPADMDQDSLEGDVVMFLFSKLFTEMSNVEKLSLTKEINSLLKESFPNSELHRRRLWETFLVTAPSY